MTGGKSDKDSDEKRFNETLQRMLKTPPTKHEADSKGKEGKGRAARTPVQKTKYRDDNVG